MRGNVKILDYLIDCAEQAKIAYEESLTYCDPLTIAGLKRHWHERVRLANYYYLRGSINSTPKLPTYIVKHMQEKFL